MSRRLQLSLPLMDGLFVAYWVLASLESLGFIRIPPSWLSPTTPIRAL